ncbi:MAG: DUF494 family protein [Melioribacteraceae bacterium]|nr:DUF494 family protein [Melioribacteraceae bacterium]
MTNKIVEVLTEILDSLNKDYQVEEVSELLSNKNFDEQTVSVAFSLVYDKVLSGKISQDNRKEKNRNIRVLSEEEKEVLGFENYNYLLKLVNVGLLDSLDFELVLEQLLLAPEESITKEDINLIILISLVDFNSEILPGSRVLLYSSDIIN